MRRSSNKTEQKAISVLRDILDNIETLTYSFNEGDKNISWDGDIKLYRNSNIDDKGNLSSIVRVQIKGRTQKITNSDKISYWIDKKDLENYLLENGTMFFVVFFNRKGEHKIYYLDLLPYNIRKILKEEINHKNEIKVKLKSISDTPSDFERVLRNFEADKKQQQKISEKVFEQEDISFSIDGANSKLRFYNWSSEKDRINSLIGIEKYIYELDKNDNVINVKVVTFSAISEPYNIKVKDKVGKIYFDRIDCLYTAEDRIINVGKSLKIYLNKNMFNIKIQGTLKERINTLEFIEKIHIGKGFFINEKWQPLENGISKIEQFVNELGVYKRILDFLNNHNISKDINLDKWTWDDIHKFEVWIKAIDEGIAIRVDSFKTSVIGSIKINDIRFSIFAERKDDGKIFVKSIWHSSISKHYMFMRGNPDDENKFETTNIFDFLNKEAYLSDDIDFEEMKKYYDNNKIEQNEEFSINMQILELILAYDESKNPLLLEYADFLLDKIIELDSIKDIAFINRCQIRKRLNTLTLDEKIELNRILEKNQGEYFDISIDLILDKKEEALKKFINMPKDLQEEYKRFPIAKYLN